MKHPGYSGVVAKGIALLRELEGSRFLFAIIRAIRVEFGSVADP